MRAKAFAGVMFLHAIFFGAIGMTALLPLAGAQAQFWRPSPAALVWHGNDTGGIIPWSCENEAAAPQAAAGYCSRFNKYGRITGVTRQYGNYISFNCLWSPDADRYSRPPVPTRAACAAETQRVWAK
jgi:hypothetical protein